MNTSAFKPAAGDCLLVIDVQNDFCTGGALAVPEGEAVVPGINALMAEFDKVVLTQDWHPAGHSSFASEHAGQEAFGTIEMPYGPQTLWPDHCIQGTHGAAFHPDLDNRPAQLIIRKGFRKAIDSYSAFHENDHSTSTGLAGWLRERKVQRVVCVGLAHDFCVRFSAVDARREGFDTVVIESLTRAIDLDGSRDAARAAMREAGVVLI
ncbi:MAG: nicotinamidase/pyrazinamidase [Gammaproteobacteria bacterium]|nr:MAG: nicotinamidase/pyrazinamidase [Gammaproteobacteria bacterium]